MGEVFLKFHIEALEEGGYAATSPDLPGLVAQGRTLAETTEITHDVARKLIESYEEHGDHMPSGIKRTGRGFNLTAMQKEAMKSGGTPVTRTRATIPEPHRRHALGQTAPFLSRPESLLMNA